jgi:hypothetical protein
MPATLPMHLEEVAQIQQGELEAFPRDAPALQLLQRHRLLNRTQQQEGWPVDGAKQRIADPRLQALEQARYRTAPVSLQ